MVLVAMAGYHRRLGLFRRSPREQTSLCVEDAANAYESFPAGFPSHALRRFPWFPLRCCRTVIHLDVPLDADREELSLAFRYLIEFARSRSPIPGRGGPADVPVFDPNAPDAGAAAEAERLRAVRLAASTPPPAPKVSGGAGDGSKVAKPPSQPPPPITAAPPPPPLPPPPPVDTHPDSDDEH
jgi:hypothetical protein